MSASFYDLMCYAKTGIAAQGMTAYDKIRALAMAGGAKYPVMTITGVPPISFLSDGRPLDNVSIIGNGQQTGTPTPDAPIYPDFVGTMSAGSWTVPISCGGQTVTVDLSAPLRKIGDYDDSMQYTTQKVNRKIGVIALTGNEGWIAAGEGSAIRFYTQDYSNGIMSSSPAFCTDYTYGDSTLYGQFEITASRSIMINRTGESLADFKLRLSERYTIGNPVTIWYVLSTPTTEPITIPQIQTARGSNTMIVETDLQPSEMSITGHIKPL